MYIGLFWMLRAACCGVQAVGFFVVNINGRSIAFRISQFFLSNKTSCCASAAIIVPLKWLRFLPSLLCLE